MYISILLSSSYETTIHIITETQLKNTFVRMQFGSLVQKMNELRSKKPNTMNL